tara:strand:- start:886 stop:2781 length:1896 start_codon:yes stop_codon:yes gene_type:complete
MIDNQTISQIKEQIEIVDVVGDFINLKKSGSSYKALSPFSSEKTPSFFVSPTKQIFKCFSTGKGGDAIEFLMLIDGLSYVEALKYLAKKYGIEIVENTNDNYSSSDHSKKESLHIILSKSVEYFKKSLQSDEGKKIAYSYLKERGFDDEVIKKFDVGFAIDKWDDNYNYLKNFGFKKDLIIDTGLVIEKNNKLYDRFRNRIIFPIHNISGKVIAFGARTLIDTSQPKYINSPETILYKKSHVLYGIFQSKNEIRKENKCYVVEGYTDVISLHQKGIYNVVASSGTSLTSDQIKLIKRYTNNITILFDGDDAGIKASLRGIDLILESDTNVRVILFPNGEDPDSYSKKVNSSLFKDYLIDNEIDFVTFKIDLLKKISKNDPLKKVDTIKEIINSISKIPDTLKRSVYVKESSLKLEIDENILISELNKTLLKNNYSRKNLLKSEKAKNNKKLISIENVISLQENECIRILVNYGTSDKNFTIDRLSFIKYFLNEIEDVKFNNTNHLSIIESFRESLVSKKPLDINFFLNHSDKDLKNEVIDLLSSKYELSENWIKKYKITTVEEKEILKKASLNSILRLKFRLIQKMIDNNIQLLNNDNLSEKEEKEIISDHQKLKKIEVEIAGELGNVTTK